MPGNRWEKDLPSLQQQFEAFKSQVDQGQIPLSEVPDLIKIPGRSRHGIRNKLVRLGLIEKTKTQRIWCESEDRTLNRVAKRRGARTLKSNGHFKKRTVWSLAKRKSRLGLVNEELSRNVREGTRLHGEALDSLRESLQQHGCDRPTEWFEWQWGVTRGSVKRRLEQLGITVTRKDVLAMSCTKVRRKRKATLATVRRGIAQREGLLAELRAKQRLFADGKQHAKMRRCANSECRLMKDGPLYAHTDFFERWTKRSDGVVIGHYFKQRCHHCRACAAAAKAAKRRGYDGLLERCEAALETLASFGSRLYRISPALWRDADAWIVQRRMPFERIIGRMELPRLLEVARGTVAAYTADPQLNLVLQWIESADFDGEPELRTDVWALDELLRTPGIESTLLHPDGGLAENGRALALLLFRVFGLVRFASDLL